MTATGPVVGDAGELELLRLLQPHLASAGERLLVPAGDDGAVWRPAAGKAVVTTTDSLVEDVHFYRADGDAGFYRDLGWKLLAVSLSDIAAMGAEPGPSFFALTLPGDWPVGDLEALYDGLSDCAARWGTDLAGGNLSAGRVAVLTSVCLGEVAADRVLRRADAEPGWSMAVTGRLGGASAALRVLHDPESEAARTAAPEQVARWRARLRRPLPRLAEAQALVDAGIRVSLDVSDGVFLDARRLLREGLGLLIDLDGLPLEDGVREAFPDAWLEVTGGGEDYELLFAGPADVVEAACAGVEALGTEARVIGRFDRGQGLRLSGADAADALAPDVGHRHFGAAR
ncbi:MAG TPA: thiamine-phosphate kinase [Candidatus Solibacter sp.]|nr:thiamine-phosphate kinase [Candidatus Solibacter sp.]